MCWQVRTRSIGAQIVAAARNGENDPSSPRYLSSTAPPSE